MRRRDEFPRKILIFIFNRHRWIPEQKEWVKESTQRTIGGHTKAKRQPGNPIPHLPRSLEGEAKPRAGLGNLLRVL